MKLTDYIKEHYAGNASEYARVAGYHLTQVKRCIDQGGLIDKDGNPYFKKYLSKANKKEKANEQSK